MGDQQVIQLGMEISMRGGKTFTFPVGNAEHFKEVSDDWMGVLGRALKHLFRR